MLKSYEAIYHNGHLHWTGQIPPSGIEKRRVLVVVDIDSEAKKDPATIRTLLERSRGCVKPLRKIEDIDNDISKTRAEWDLEWDK
ncbi:MAG: hypothetical protein A2075_06145 [Geobacteraceae bacterium GWC2_58_44]|nr:MAG: hypothetical protein A2075_06145 [Geobacteraceae bacterium GWC2_58_44]HBG05744.1 hypothetical protein [Geobacter sp.]